MRKDGKLKKFFIFQMYECAAVEEFLAEMALEGWMVEKIKGSFFTFHKIEPKKLTFAVDIFDKASEFDTIPADSTMEYIEYCKEAGWEYICARGKLQVFCSENENGIPIQTDPKLKLKAINKGMLIFVFQWLLLIFSGLLYLFSHIQWNFIQTLTSYSLMGMFLFWIVMTIFNLTNIFDYGLWVLQATKSIKADEVLNYNTKKNKHNKNIFKLSLIIFQGIIFMAIYTYDLAIDYTSIKLKSFLWCIAIIIILFITMYIYYKNKNHSRSTNIAFTIVLSIFIPLIFFYWLLLGAFSGLFNHPNAEMITLLGKGDVISTTFTLNHDQVPITVEDFGIDALGYRDSSSYIDKSFLAQKCDYLDQYFVDVDIDAPHNGLDYSVITSPYHWVINLSVKSLLDSHYDDSISVVDDDIWDANLVYSYRTSNNTSGFIVIYDNKILDFESDINLGSNEINIIREKLDLFN